MQVYHQQQSPQLQQTTRKQQEASNLAGPDDENRPPAAGGAGLVWEPRDPPLQYSVIPHQQHQQQQHGVTPIKSRLEPRRSASLSQADLVTYDGKVLGRLHPHSSQSPPRPPPPQESAANRYQEYYETKYEKPVRRSDAGQQPVQQRGRPLGGVDVDTIWKSRWRSTSPPPAPVDDWLPIKPPQLAWAKPVQLPIVELPVVPRNSSSRKTSRIPLPVNHNNMLARSMSGDMDHMIYLERDMPDARLMFRERTRSIDRGLAQQQQQHPQSQRMTYKTYEEELADYHGRTGSVDRLASTQRGRPRTIRMGTQSQVGRSVPASLERRHSEVDRSSSRRRESGDSSNSSGTRQQSSRRGSSSTVDITNDPPVPKSRNNVNRVYIDGQEEPVVLRNQPSAIRVTMTDTRSLKRPTNRAGHLPPTQNDAGHESSTMPRMSKRHGIVPQTPQRVTGIVHPGTTTVYLAQDQEAPPARHDADSNTAAYRKATTTKRIKTDADGGQQGNNHTFIHHHAHPPLLFFHLSPIQQTVL